MEIKRDLYLKRLIASMGNGMIKAVTGIRRCGKTYLLFKLFYDYLIREGVPEDHIIRVPLDDRMNKSLRNPDNLLAFLRESVKDKEMYYIILDEVQMVGAFEDVLNSLLHIDNADVYASGSNARFLSKDIITEFRGRGDEIQLRPLDFHEFASVYEGEESAALRDFMFYGGLPQVAIIQDVEKKKNYLQSVFQSTYLRDIKERYTIKNDVELSELIDVIASSIGGFTNPTKLEHTFRTVKHSNITANTISSYLSILQDAFLIEKSLRYEIKGRKYIESPAKYYFSDLGLRNARLDFRQVEETHLMENLIYNELRVRGYSIDVGTVYDYVRNEKGNSVRRQLEVDFVCNMGYQRYYIQSAWNIPDGEKRRQETASLQRIGDNFKKIVIVGGYTPTHRDEDGILILNVMDFLKGDEKILDV